MCLKRVIITGATGFLGRYLLSHLVGSFDLVSVSRTSGAGVVQAPNYASVPDGDLLIHLAEESDRAAANRAGEAHVEASTRVARALSRRFEGRMIYASSAVVYGDAAGHAPFCVSDPVVSIDAYTRAKILAEAAVLEEGGTVVRLANLFGPGMSKSNVMSHILRQIPGDGPVFVRDDTPVRDFLAVDDAARLFTLLARHRVRGVINAGSGVGTAICALAKTALELCDDVGREIVATRPGSCLSVNVLDVEETANILGWAPSRTLAEYMNTYFFGKG